MPAPSPFQNLIVSFVPGERIFSEGEVGATLFIVQSGRARLFRQTGGKTVEIAEMEKGDFFGEMSLLEGTARNHSAEAAEPTELIEINTTTFDRMIRGNIEIAVRMIRKLSGRLQKTEVLLAAKLCPPASSVEASLSGRVIDQPPAASSHPLSATPRTAAPEPARGPAPVRTQVPRPTPVLAPSGSGVRPSPPIAVPAHSGRATALAPAPARTTAVAARDMAVAGPRLLSESGDAVFPIRSSEATVGRYDPVTETQPEVDLTLVDIKRSVSRRHAKITARDGSFFLTEEVGALNGTFINGSKLVTGKPAPLRNGDQISVGTVHLVFRS